MGVYIMSNRTLQISAFIVYQLYLNKINNKIHMETEAMEVIEIPEESYIDSEGLG